MCFRCEPTHRAIEGGGRSGVAWSGDRGPSTVSKAFFGSGNEDGDVRRRGVEQGDAVRDDAGRA